MIYDFKDGEGRFSNMVRICGVFDHSVIDGARGAKFMASLEGLLAHPLKSLVE